MEFIKLKVSILIPAYNPTEKLLLLINELVTLNFNNIIIVNDGSDCKSKDIFLSISSIKQCSIIEHKTNKGKGAALKTGIKAFLQQQTDHIGLVTADADYQHKPEDILKVAQALEENEHSIILGVRNFDSDNVPFKSKNGNKITRLFFYLATGEKITDTQTGLRAFSKQGCKNLTEIKGERFEYEINVLLYACKQNMNIIQVPIETVYYDNNDATSFHAVFDAAKVFLPVLFFAGSSFLCSIIDVLAFSVFLRYVFNADSSYNILFSTIIARVISSIMNFLINKRLVFRSKSKSAVKYFSLVLIQMILSGLAVSFFSNIIALPSETIKIIIDIVLFFVSYYVQSRWIFKK